MMIYKELVEENIHMYFLSPSLDIRVQNREAPVLIRALILPEVSTKHYFLSPSLDIRVQNREAPVLIRALFLPGVSTKAKPSKVFKTLYIVP